MKSFTKDSSPKETGSKGKALRVIEAITGKTSPKVTILKKKKKNSRILIGINQGG